MEQTIERQAIEWVTTERPLVSDISFLAETRDIFQARLDQMLRGLLRDGIITETNIYILSAIAGEIGNNSFDHNLGSWPDTMGIFFGFKSADGRIQIVLADRGQGVLKTLRKVRPGLETDAEALKVAFTEKLSGRAPEARGNGLKFVKENVRERNMYLSFRSGNAKAELNATMEIEPSGMTVYGCLAILTLDEQTYAH